MIHLQNETPRLRLATTFLTLAVAGQLTLEVDNLEIVAKYYNAIGEKYELRIRSSFISFPDRCSLSIAFAY